METSSGGSSSPPTSDGRIIRWLFLRGMGLVHLVAHLSLWVQLSGLIGVDGISPANDVMAQLNDLVADDTNLSPWHFPTLFWLLGTSNLALHVLAGVGSIASIVLLFGLAPRLMLILLWCSYLSFFTVTKPFLGFQWDILLLESTFLAILYAPSGWSTKLNEEAVPPRWMVWTLRFLLFKLVISSGLVKLASGDPSWQDLSALDYHFWTQPLPHALSWWAHHMPDWSRALGVFFNHFVELCVPFLIIFNPRQKRLLAWFAINLTALMPWSHDALDWLSSSILGINSMAEGYSVSHCAVAALSGILLGGRIWPGGSDAHPGRRAAAGLIIGLMVSVGLTGNYGYFNLLTIVLCIPLLDDALVKRLWFIKNSWPDMSSARPATPWKVIPIFCVAITLSGLSAMQLLHMIVPSETVGQTQNREGSSDDDNVFSLLSGGQKTLARWARKYAAVNGYGLFARMTKTRFELQVEGSIDGEVWRPYSFRYKPNSPGEMPTFAGIHMPRLDWQLWFSALRPRCSERWFLRFLQRLTNGVQPVEKLLESSPFRGRKPQFVRVKRIPVTFSESESESWWTFGSAEPYCPQLSRARLKAILTTRKP